MVNKDLLWDAVNILVPSKVGLVVYYKDFIKSVIKRSRREQLLQCQIQIR